MLLAYDGMECAANKLYNAGVQALGNSATNPYDGKFCYAGSANGVVREQPNWGSSLTDSAYYWGHMAFRLDSVSTVGTIVLFYDGNAPTTASNYLIKIPVTSTGGVGSGTSIDLYKNGTTSGGTSLSSTAFTFAEDTWYWIAVRFGRASPYPIEVWVDDVKIVDYAGDAANPQPSRGRFCYGTGNDGGKGAYTVMLDDLIVLDDQDTGTGYTTRLAKGLKDIVGLQPTNDVTGWNDFTASTGTKKYRCVDDYYDHVGTPASPTDYVQLTTSTGSQLFALADDLTVTGQVDAIEPFSLTANQKIADDAMILWVDGEAKYEYAEWALPQGGFRYPSDGSQPCRMTTPAGNAWTATTLDNLFIGLRRYTSSATAFQSEIFMLEVIGEGLTRPADNANSDNGDVSPPTAPSTTAVNRVYQLNQAVNRSNTY